MTRECATGKVRLVGTKGEANNRSEINNPDRVSSGDPTGSSRSIGRQSQTCLAAVAALQRTGAFFPSAEYTPETNPIERNEKPCIQLRRVPI